MAARQTYRVRMQRQELLYNAGETVPFTSGLANELVARGHTAVDALPSALPSAKLALPLKAAMHHGSYGAVVDESDRQVVMAEYGAVGSA